MQYRGLSPSVTPTPSSHRLRRDLRRDGLQGAMLHTHLLSGPNFLSQRYCTLCGVQQFVPSIVPTGILWLRKGLRDRCLRVLLLHGAPPWFESSATIRHQRLTALALSNTESQKRPQSLQKAARFCLSTYSQAKTGSRLSNCYHNKLHLPFLDSVNRIPLTSQLRYGCTRLFFQHLDQPHQGLRSDRPARGQIRYSDVGTFSISKVLDHLVIGRQRYVSLRERGVGFGTSR